jgi:hypothetical protein
MLNRFGGIFLLSFVLVLGACSSGGTRIAPISQRLIETNSINSAGSVLTINYEYDDVGGLLTQTNRRDGEIVEITNYETSDQRQVLSFAVDRDVDGSPDYIYHYRYTDGLGLSHIDIANAEGEFVSVNAYDYDNGVIVSRVHYNIVDVDSVDAIVLSDDRITTRQSFSYENNQVVSRSFFNADGMLESVTTFTYNTDGTLAGTSSNSVTEGAIRSSTHVYETGSCTSAGNPSFLTYHCVN